MINIIRMHRLITVKKFGSHSYSSVAKNLGTKLNEFPAEQIANAVEKTPELKQFTKDQWLKTFETFIDQGFATSNFMRIICGRPQLLKRSPDKLVESIECLRQTQFGDKSIIELVEHHPELLEYTNKNGLRKRLALLKTYAQTERNIFRIFFGSPNLITDPEQSITKKFDYLKNVMKVDETEASKSRVFSYPLDEIKCRHVFLSRLGLFKPKNPKVTALQPSNNPKMAYIYDTSDKDFAFKTCRVTLEEFETFQELYKREQERNERDLEDDEDDIDDADELMK